MSITSQTSNPNDNLSVVLLLYSSQHTWCSIHGVNGELTGFCGHFNGCDCHSCIGGEYVCSKNKLNGKNKQNEISRKERRTRSTKKPGIILFQRPFLWVYFPGEKVYDWRKFMRFRTDIMYIL